MAVDVVLNDGKETLVHVMMDTCGATHSSPHEPTQPSDLVSHDHSDSYSVATDLPPGVGCTGERRRRCQGRGAEGAGRTLLAALRAASPRGGGEVV